MARLKQSVVTAAAIARTDWKAVAEDRQKTIVDLNSALAEQMEKTERLEQLLREARGERDRWSKVAADNAQQRNDALQAQYGAERETTVQARRADFWKGVAMGFDPVRATAIEERQRDKQYGGTMAKESLIDKLYKDRG